jgi:hypothetical protein
MQRSEQRTVSVDSPAVQHFSTQPAWQNPQASEGFLKRLLRVVFSQNPPSMTALAAEIPAAAPRSTNPRPQGQGRSQQHHRSRQPRVAGEQTGNADRPVGSRSPSRRRRGGHHGRPQQGNPGHGQQRRPHQHSSHTEASVAKTETVTTPHGDTE